MNKIKKAQILFEKTKVIREKIYHAYHPTLAVLYNNFGILYYNLNKLSLSLEYFLKSKTIIEYSANSNHPSLVEIYRNLAVFYDNTNEKKKARDYYEKCRKMLLSFYEEDHPNLADICYCLGKIMVFCDKERALGYMKKCKRIREKNLPRSDMELAEIYNDLGVCFLSKNDRKKAFKYYEKSRKMSENAKVVDYYELSTVYSNLGTFYERLNEVEKALEFYGKCKDIREKTLYLNHPSISSICLKIETLYNKVNAEQTAENLDKKNRKVLTKLFNIDHYHIPEDFLKVNSITTNLKDDLFTISQRKIRDHTKCTNNIFNKKSIVLFKAHSKIFPYIYNKTRTGFLKEQIYPVIDIHEKEIRNNKRKWINIYCGLKEIIFLSKLRKSSDCFPDLFYYTVTQKYNEIFIKIGLENYQTNFMEFMSQNQNLSERDMKILFYNIIKAYYWLHRNHIVHSDVHPYNILVQSIDKVKLCDLTDSYQCINDFNINPFPLIQPRLYAIIDYLSPEIKTMFAIQNEIAEIKYNPFKSDIFSLGLSFLSACRINIKGLNNFVNFTTSTLRNCSQ